MDMLLPIRVNKRFLNLFRTIKLDRSPQQSTVNLHVLDIVSNSFIYDKLVEELRELIVCYVHSNRRLAEFNKIYPAYSPKPYLEAIQKFRNYTSNEGELGELLLYAFLESSLNAPKLLSKMELKTDANDYIKGSDGIHLLEVGNGYQLIFGESKMYADLLEGAREAFDSIAEFKINGLGFERGLIDTHVINEMVTEEGYETIKSILLPSGDDGPDLDLSFGVFLGFELPIDSTQLSMKNSEFREWVHSVVQSNASRVIDTIQKRIIKHNLFGHEFHIYIVPFTEIDITRKKLIQEMLTIG
ncbi:HamA C-terminal domain-containing protein [Serratia sp. 2723]|uniref:HamA C-terminal domain-containing protein n=1 Tax=unclassified Serratia (in: enterobacteria) TaxID=2647522 RepID=UPI003D1E7E11